MRHPDSRTGLTDRDDHSDTMKSITRKAAAIAAALVVGSCGSSGSPTCSVSGGQPLASTAWPKYRGDIHNTGRSSVDLSGFAASGELELFPGFPFTTGGAVGSSPAIGPNSEIYVGSSDFRAYRINQDGSLAWQATTNNTITSGPALDGAGNVFFTSNDGNLYTFDAEDGSQLRGTVPLIGLLSSPTVAPPPNQGIVYAGSLSTGTISVCPNNVVRWTAQVVSVASTPAIDFASNIYVAGASNGRTLISLDDTFGQTNWIFTATAPINASPIIADDGTAFTIDTRGRLFAVNSVDGTSFAGVIFDASATDPNIQVFASPALGTPSVANGIGVLYIPDTGGSLTAVQPEVDGNGNVVGATVKWTFRTPSGASIQSSPIVTADDTIIFGADDGVVYALQDEDTTFAVRWTYQTGGPVQSSPALTNAGTIVVGSNDRKVYALVPPSAE